MWRAGRALIAATATACLAIALVAPAANAAAPKFHSTSSSVGNDGSLTVSFDERGVGNENVDITLTADAAATYACFNRGGHNPSASNKRTVNQEVTAGSSFEPKNGRIRASLTAGPPSPGDFSCPGGQQMVLADVSYTNIVLTDTTNGVSTSVADASRTFRDV